MTTYQVVSVESANQTIDPNAGELNELLDAVDALAMRAGGKRKDKRAIQRRRLRAPCDIRYLESDGVTVRTAVGRTRELTRTGMSFLSERELPRGTLVRLDVRLRDGKHYNLTGAVMHARAEKRNWHLIGVKFKKLTNKNL